MKDFIASDVVCSHETKPFVLFCFQIKILGCCAQGIHHAAVVLHSSSPFFIPSLGSLVCSGRASKTAGFHFPESRVYIDPLSMYTHKLERLV